MAKFTPRSFIVSAALTAAIWFVLIPVQSRPGSGAIE
jgi:hypothetical protein